MVQKYHSGIQSCPQCKASHKLFMWIISNSYPSQKNETKSKFEGLLQMLTSWSPNERLQVRKYLPEMSEKASYHAP